MTSTSPAMLPPKPPAGAMLENALEMFEMGLTVIPLGDPWSRPPPSVKGETEEERRAAWCKTPRIQWKGFQDQAPTEMQVRDWWTRWPSANIGVLTGVVIQPGGTMLAVVDADSAEADSWLEHSSEVRPTPVMTQTSRGRHRWYRMSKTLKVTNASSSSKIDIRGAGGYVVAPGSTYGCGARNEWLIAPGWDLQEFDNLPELTAADLGAIQRRGGAWGATDEHGAPRGPVTKTASADEAVLADLGSVRLPHDGSPVAPGGRNQALASLVGQWAQAGLSIQRILQEADRWNSRNPQPLPQAEVVATVVSILSTHVRNHGAQPHTQEPVPRGGIKVISRGESRSEPPEIPETYWQEGVLFDGARMLISGPPKIGKSNLVIQLALAAASGGEFLGASFERPLRVLWLQAEIREGFVAPRLERLERGLDSQALRLIDQNFHYTDRCDLDLLDGPSFDLAGQMLEQMKPELLIIDPVVNFSSADENDNAEMRKLLRLVDTLGERHGCAIVLVHHTRKDVAAGSFDAIRGASALRGWFDTGLLLTGSPGDAQAILSCELRNARAVPASTLERTESGRFIPWQIDEDGESADPTVEGVMPHNAGSHQTSKKPQSRKSANLTTTESRKLSILEILSRSQPLYYNDLVTRSANTIKIGERTAQALVGELAAEGRVVQFKEGRATLYRIAPDTS